MTELLIVTTDGIGRVVDDGAIDLLDTEFRDLGEALAAGTALSDLVQAPVRQRVARADAEILPPVPRPGALWAVGLNYAAHVAELSRPKLTEPFIFPKAPSAIVADGTDIVLPAVAPDTVDYEGEMALIIGKGGKDIAAADAWSHVAGLTVCNDVSERTGQKGSEGIRANISMAKSFDTFAPLGPTVAVVDSVPDFSAISLTTYVNDEVRQSGTLDQMIFGVPTLIEYLSRRVTLAPGDIIATGTPDGVGDVDGRFLRPGDTVRIELSGVGTLTNSVVAA
jgi:2-keto-4-pentenoate hydratase/2-oxohepta-3-ene-1,7-dioic acid hydratase in catechol pathway